MNYNEIIENIREICDEVSSFAYYDFGTQMGQMGTYVEGVGCCQELQQKGGEGEGSEWYSVKYFPDHDVYIKVEGYYASYDGTDFYDGWESCKEVRPKQVMITVYDPI